MDGSWLRNPRSGRQDITSELRSEPLKVVRSDASLTVLRYTLVAAYVVKSISGFRLSLVVDDVECELVDPLQHW